MSEIHLKIHILGSGTSTGVPIVGCPCSVCKSLDPKDKRLRSSILIEDLTNQQNILVDTSPDLRAQLLKANISKIDHVIFTHTHADHSHGFDELRAIYFNHKKKIQCWLQKEHKMDIETRFSYAFSKTGYQGTTPQTQLNEIIGSKIPIPGLDIEWISLEHGNTESTAFKINDFAYATDFKIFTKEDKKKWNGKITTMIASGLGFFEHPTHSSIPETIELCKDLEVKNAYLTHLSHKVDYKRDQKKIPSFIKISYDGMIIETITKNNIL